MARLIETGSDEEKWCKEKHLENNTFGDQVREERGFLGGFEGAGEGDGGRNCFIEGEEVRVVVVRVREGRIADWKGGVKDWRVVSEGEEGETEGLHRGRDGLVNGIL